MPQPRETLSWQDDSPRAYLTVAHLRSEKHGSMEDQLLALAKVLRRGGVQADFLFSAWPIWSLQDDFHARGARIGVVDFARPFFAAAALHRAIRRRRYEVVHFHFLRPHHPFVLAARSAGARVLLTDHMVLGHLAEHQLAVRSASKRPVALAKSLARNALLGAVERRIAVSQAVAESILRIERVPKERLRVVPNGIDVARFRVAPDVGKDTRRQLGLLDDPVVMCVARFDRDKGVDVLIRAVGCARRDSTLGRARLLLVGDGAGREEVDSLARTAGVRDRIVFMGVRSDLERLYPAADVVVVPSRCAESCSLVVLESQACGVPLVASNVGGIPEHVQHGVGGLLVPPDEPEALAAALEQELESPELRHRMSEAGHRWAQQFALEPWVDRLLAAADFAEVSHENTPKNGQVI